MTAARSILDLWPDLVDARTGSCGRSRSFRRRRRARLRALPVVRIGTAAFGFLPNFGNNGGVGATARTAIAKALGEAVERYCSALFRYDELDWAPYAGLGMPAMHPESFALYSPAQYAVRLPLAAVHDGYPRRLGARQVAGDRRRDHGSGGVHLRAVPLPARPWRQSRHPADLDRSRVRCVLRRCRASALCEVVERDAFTRTWQARSSIP